MEPLLKGLVNIFSLILPNHFLSLFFCIALISSWKYCQNFPIYWIYFTSENGILQLFS